MHVYFPKNKCTSGGRWGAADASSATSASNTGTAASSSASAAARSSGSRKWDSDSDDDDDGHGGARVSGGKTESTGMSDRSDGKGGSGYMASGSGSGGSRKRRKDGWGGESKKVGRRALSVGTSVWSYIGSKLLEVGRRVNCDELTGGFGGSDPYTALSKARQRWRCLPHITAARHSSGASG